MSLFRQFKRIAVSSHPTAKSPSPVSVPTLPTLPPKILAIVFLNLSQGCLRIIVSLVCRQWYKISRPLIVKTVRWTAIPRSDDAERSTLRELNYAQVLTCQRQAPPCGQLDLQLSGNEIDRWNNLVYTLKSLTDEELRIKTLMHSVDRESASWSDVLPLLEPLGSSLTSLQIENLPERTVFPWKLVRKKCPGLLHLSLHGDLSCRVSPQLEDPQNGILCTVTSLGTASAADANDESSSAWRLKTCILQNFILTETSLKPLIRASPELHKLHLVLVRPLDSSLAFTQDTTLFHVPETRLAFYQFLSNHSPKIQSFHLSLPKSIVNNSDTLSKLFPFHAFPNIHRWSFAVESMAAPMFAFLTIHQTVNRLTTLEILGETPKYSERNPYDKFSTVGPEAIVGDLLHLFLCRSPNLLHLKASNVNLELSLLSNFKGKSPYIPTIDYASNEGLPPEAGATQQLWACRDLKTLYLRFDQHRVQDDHGHKNSRILYGYISRVCPNLEDLSIRREKLTIALDSGLCLLSNLKKLQRLQMTIGGGIRKIFEDDMKWIQRYYDTDGLTERRVLERIQAEKQEQQQQRGGGTLKSTKKRRGLLSKFGQSKSSGNAEDVGVQETSCLVEGVDMRHWGELVDVAEYLQDRQVQSEEILWPAMEYFEMKYTYDYGMTPEELEMLPSLIEKYRPEIHFRQCIG
ncbi:hypothetical protein EDD21DRAFT_82428 [Dissophora ornata]|nr:hypothetical protein BGZ58_005003 [Dissophora ornata]KAI8602264.1 hypothetical protein EDD21DRAFT_82428 [Dissophora ornata]